MKPQVPISRPHDQPDRRRLCRSYACFWEPQRQLELALMFTMNYHKTSVARLARPRNFQQFTPYSEANNPQTLTESFGGSPRQLQHKTTAEDVRKSGPTRVRVTGGCPLRKALINDAF